MFAARNMMFAGGFNPLSLSPALWLDASDAATLLDAGGLAADADEAIATWSDKSGNARHATQSTSGSRPLRKTAQQNSRDVVRFDGTDDFLFAPDWHQNTISVFAVYKPANNANLQHVLRKGNTPGTSLEFAMRAASATTALFGACTSAFVSNTQAKPGSGAPLIHTGVYDGAAVESWVNGAGYTTAAQTGNIFNGSFRLRIGAALVTESDAAAAAFSLQGDIAEILIFPTALSTTNRQAVESYLNQKWAIY